MSPIEEAIVFRDPTALLRAYLAAPEASSRPMTFDHERTARAAAGWCTAVIDDFEARASWSRTEGRA